MNTGHELDTAPLGSSPVHPRQPPAGARRENRQWLKVAQVVVLITALGIVAVGLAAAAFGILAGALGSPGDTLPLVTMSLAFLALCVALGSALAWQAWQASQGRESSPFLPSRIRLLVVLYALAILAGQLILSRNLLPQLTFPPFHVIATVLPPVIVLWLVGRSLGGVTRWRDIDLQLSSGAFLSTALALLLESALVIGLLMIVVAVVVMQPDGLVQIQAFMDHMQDPAWLQDPSGWAPLARSPIVVALALAVSAVAIPIIEEAVKNVGVGLMFYRRPGLPEAFLWGLAGGAGFAIAEGMLSTTASLEGWASVVLLRVGATMLHCVTGGLMGLAWYAVLAQRLWLRGIALYVVSVGIHGTWNALTVGMALVSVSSQGGIAEGTSSVLAGASTVLVLSLLLALSLASSLGLVGLTRYARNWRQPVQASGGRAGDLSDALSTTGGAEGAKSNASPARDGLE